LLAGAEAVLRVAVVLLAAGVGNGAAALRGRRLRGPEQAEQRAHQRRHQAHPHDCGLLIGTGKAKARPRKQAKSTLVLASLPGAGPFRQRCGFRSPGRADASVHPHSGTARPLSAADPPDPVSAGRPRPTVCEHPRLTPFLIDRGFRPPTPLGSLTVLTRPPVLPLSTAVRGVWTREEVGAVDDFFSPLPGGARE